MADRQPQADAKPFQLGLMRILLGVSVICGISAFSPFIGMIVVAYTPCLIGLLMLRHGARNGRETAVGWGVVLMCVGFILGSLVLTAIGNLDALEIGAWYSAGV